jgi:zinc protease
LAKGENSFRFERGKEDKSLIVGVFAGELPYSEATALKLNALSDAMNIIITEEMREKIQGIYGGGTNAGINRIPYSAFQMILQLPCGPAKVDTLIAAFNQELKGIAEKGIDASYADKVKKAWMEKYKVDVKRNEYWLGALQDMSRGDLSQDRFLKAATYYEALTAKDIQDAARLVRQAGTKLIAVQMPEHK